MIRFGFGIAWPFRHRDKQKHFVLFEKHIAAHKYFELQFSQFGLDQLIEFDLDLNWRGHDHAGPRLELSLFGYFFAVKIYDNRHWNYDENRWENDRDWGI